MSKQSSNIVLCRWLRQSSDSRRWNGTYSFHFPQLLHQSFLPLLFLSLSNKFTKRCTIRQIPWFFFYFWQDTPQWELKMFPKLKFINKHFSIFNHLWHIIILLWFWWIPANKLIFMAVYQAMSPSVRDCCGDQIFMMSICLMWYLKNKWNLFKDLSYYLIINGFFSPC